MIFPYIAVAGAIIFTGVGQLFLKRGSQYGGKELFLRAYLNRFTFLGYGLFLLVMLLSIYALHFIPLKLLYALNSLNFIMVLILSWHFLGEHIDFQKIMAVICIILGVMIFNFG